MAVGDGSGGMKVNEGSVLTVKARFRHIAVELREHAPFTLLGAGLGVVFMLLFRNISRGGATVLFGVFHPGHVLLSAMVTAALFKVHKPKAHILLVLVIGYVGSIGVATLSDSVIPYFGERLLGLDIPRHDHGQHGGEDEHDEEAGHCEHGCEEERGLSVHSGFIEEWYIVNPAAILGVLIAFYLPRTRLPHAGHVLISTWASSAHVLMEAGGRISAGVAVGMFFVLFLAVWIPCCISDIVFPTLFVDADGEWVGHGH